MEVVDYSEKSFVVFGEETRNKTAELKEFGGRYNPNLTHPETKQKCAGWIFSKKKKDTVQEWIQKSTNTSKLIIKKKEIESNKDIHFLEFENADPPLLKEVPSFTMIVPQVGQKIKVKNSNSDEVSLVIFETITNKDGYTFEFKAKNENLILNFVMVGKEWRRL